MNSAPCAAASTRTPQTVSVVLCDIEIKSTSYLRDSWSELTPCNEQDGSLLLDLLPKRIPVQPRGRPSGESGGGSPCCGIPVAAVADTGNDPRGSRRARPRSGVCTIIKDAGGDIFGFHGAQSSERQDESRNWMVAEGVKDERARDPHVKNDARRTVRFLPCPTPTRVPLQSIGTAETSRARHPA